MSTTAIRIRRTAAEEDDAAIATMLELSGNGGNRSPAVWCG